MGKLTVNVNLIRKRPTKDAGWEESKHKRGEGGKFASTGGSQAGAKAAAKGGGEKVPPNHEASWKEAARLHAMGAKATSAQVAQAAQRTGISPELMARRVEVHAGMAKGAQQEAHSRSANGSMTGKGAHAQAHKKLEQMGFQAQEGGRSTVALRDGYQSHIKYVNPKTRQQIILTYRDVHGSPDKNVALIGKAYPIK